MLFSIDFSHLSLLFVCKLYFQRIIFFPIWNYLSLNRSVPAGLAVIPSPLSASVFTVLLLVQDETFPNLMLSFLLPRSIYSAWACICRAACAPCLADRKGLGALTQATNPGCLEMERVCNANEHQYSSGSPFLCSACSIQRHAPPSRQEKVTQNWVRDVGCTLE